ncbi:MAG TPA: choice-of-anchor tandem repeat GloVer-containing protein [Rhizomicrobium sp.]|nr:choice-of-anchor tandem repeat GloVer-containing protein [Rhizomicrobium sp.]
MCDETVADSCTGRLCSGTSLAGPSSTGRDGKSRLLLFEERRGRAWALWLLEVKGTLYGTTNNGGANNEGVVFSLDPKTGVETVLHSFGVAGDGLQPNANMIEVGGTLYGTTLGGGANQNGTVFSIDPATGAEAVLYSFCSAQNCSDGRVPFAGLVNVKGVLFGTDAPGRHRQ